MTNAEQLTERLLHPKRTPLAYYYPGRFCSLGTPNGKEPAKAARIQFFREYCQKVADNLKTGERGYVRDFDGGFYEISKERRSARRLAENEGQEIRDAFDNAKV